MVRVADEAAVREHHVVADLDPLVGGQHHAAVEEAALADLDPCFLRHRDPAPRFEQGALPHAQPAIVEGLEELPLHRLTDVEAATSGVAVDPPAPPEAAVSLIPPALEPPEAP